MVAALAGCHRQPSDGPAAADADRIDCRPAGAQAFEPVCTVERLTGGKGLILIVRHPDGRFRRLLVTRDGRGVVAADGAEPAVVVPIGAHQIEVAIAQDHYRLPATVRAPK